MMPNNTWISCSVMAEVGSSMISTRALQDRALAISTICCWPTRRLPNGVAGSTARSSSSSRTAASWFIFAASMKPKGFRGSRPRKMFWATVRLETRFSSWKIIAMPASSASRVFENCTGSPNSRTSPLSAGNTPAITFISVDLPAPFSPSSAVKRPARNVMLTSSNALTPGKDFETPSAWRTMSPGVFMENR